MVCVIVEVGLLLGVMVILSLILNSIGFGFCRYGSRFFFCLGVEVWNGVSVVGVMI